MTTQNSDFYFPDFNVPALLSSLFTRFCMVSYLRPKLIFHDTFATNRRQLSFTYHEGGNLAASKIRNLECPSYEICLIDYGCGKFNRKIHIMEQYP